MNALVEFVVRLFGDVLQMPLLLADVALRDALSLVSVATGSVFITVAVAVFGYALLGALGVPLPHPGSGPGEQVE